MPADALVIGGGLVGLSCALNLQLQGIRTTLVDPATTRRGASWGNAGHLATEQAEPLASPKTLRSFPRRLFFRGGALSLPARDVDVWLPFALRLIRSSAPARFEAGTAALRSLLRSAIPAWRQLAGTAGAEHLLAEDGHFVVWETARGAQAGTGRVAERGYGHGNLPRCHGRGNRGAVGPHVASHCRRNPFQRHRADPRPGRACGVPEQALHSRWRHAAHGACAEHSSSMARRLRRCWTAARCYAPM